MGPGVLQKYVEALKVVGFPIAMVAVFVLWETGWLPSKTRENHVQLIELRRDIQQQNAELRREFREAVDRHTAAVVAMRSESRSSTTLSTCLAFSRTPEIQRDCLGKYQGP